MKKLNKYFRKSIITVLTTSLAFLILSIIDSRLLWLIIGSIIALPILFIFDIIIWLIFDNKSE